MSYNLSAEEEKTAILREYRKLIRHAKPILKEGDIKVIKKAFHVAAEAHKEMRRKSGEPYIFHPIAVAQICVEEVGLGTTSIVAALLHDVVEDTPITLQEIEKMFGRKVARIIDGLTKISGAFMDQELKQAENLKKIVMTLSDDVRVILIKLSDRLHNMRTLGSMPRHKQLSISSETIYLYSPLAHRLGLYNIKSEFEDLYLKYTDPESYDLINKSIHDSKTARLNFIREFIKPIQKDLREKFFEFKIKGRPKSAYSIWKKMKKQNVTIHEVYDLFAIRIIIKADEDDEKSLCWQVYSVVTDFYRPSPNRLRDWVSTPKANGYESLHTTVMSQEGKWVEVQIRTDRMDDVAERGYAAHWKYKQEGDDESGDNEGLEGWLDKVRDALGNGGDGNAKEFVEEFRNNLFQEEIFVFTPKGDLKVLPRNSKVLDLAYEVHTQIGNKCLGAKINHKHVPIGHTLNNGDQVEILTSPSQRPSEKWLDIISTSKARKQIREYLNEEKRALELKGKELLQAKLLQYDLQLTGDVESRVCMWFNVSSPRSIYHKIGDGRIDLEQINTAFDLRKIIPRRVLAEKANALKQKLSEGGKLKGSELIVGDEVYDGVNYKLSSCCTPVKGDDVLALVSLDKGVSVHRVVCEKVVDTMSNFPHRVLTCTWSDGFRENTLARIKVTGKDRAQLLLEMLTVISINNKSDISSVKATSLQGFVEDEVELKVSSREVLEKIVSEIEAIEGVVKVDRFVKIVS